MPSSRTIRDRHIAPRPFGSETVGHTGVDAMMGRLSVLAVGLTTGIAVAWVLPQLPQLLPPVATLSVGAAQQESAEPDARPRVKDDRPSVVKLDAEAIEAAGIET